MTGGHERITAPMLQSCRCGARTRKGTPCQSPAVAGSARCRMHGGSQGTGAPLANQNAKKSGFHCREAKLGRRKEQEFLRHAREFLDKMT